MYKILSVLTALALSTAFVGTASATPAPNAIPLPSPGRTQISLDTPLGRFGTVNATEARPALSIVKLYMVDYIVNRGDGTDTIDLERMIKFSDDNAAQRMWNKYGPITVSSPAAFYGLTSTWPGQNWGNSYTSVADVTTFMDAKMTDPTTPILGWMRDAAPIAADGTAQNWGTSHIPGVTGTKWGWSDYGPSDVASASFGWGFTIAANTWGFPADQTADVLGAVDNRGVVPPENLPVELAPLLYQVNSQSAG